MSVFAFAVAVQASETSALKTHPEASDKGTKNVIKSKSKSGLLSCAECKGYSG